MYGLPDDEPSEGGLYVPVSEVCKMMPPPLPQNSGFEISIVGQYLLIW